MEGMISRAIGFGIEESKMWTMTPGEILTAIKALEKQRMTDIYRLDGMFASVKKFFGGEKGTGIDDFRIYRNPAEDEREHAPQDPEQQAFILKLFAAIEQREQKRRNAHHG